MWMGETKIVIFGVFFAKGFAHFRELPIFAAKESKQKNEGLGRVCSAYGWKPNAPLSEIV